MSGTNKKKQSKVIIRESFLTNNEISGTAVPKTHVGNGLHVSNDAAPAQMESTGQSQYDFT